MLLTFCSPYSLLSCGPSCLRAKFLMLSARATITSTRETPQNAQTASWKTSIRASSGRVAARSRRAMIVARSATCAFMRGLGDHRLSHAGARGRADHSSRRDDARHTSQPCGACTQKSASDTDCRDSPLRNSGIDQEVPPFVIGTPRLPGVSPILVSRVTLVCPPSGRQTKGGPGRRERPFLCPGGVSLRPHPNPFVARRAVAMRKLCVHAGGVRPPPLRSHVGHYTKATAL